MYTAFWRALNERGLFFARGHFRVDREPGVLQVMFDFEPEPPDSVLLGLGVVALHNEHENGRELAGVDVSFHFLTRCASLTVIRDRTYYRRNEAKNG